MENDRIPCCLEHTELALDIIVDECETAPQMEKIETNESCEFCQNKAEYIVSRN